MSIPAISVVIPSYNYGKFIAQAISSVLAQDFIEFDLTIVDDNSTDNTDEIIKPYLKDKRVRYIKNQKNLGALKNINKCLSLARGKYLFGLSADDFLVDTSHFSTLYSLAEANPQAALVYGRYYIADEAGNLVKEVFHPGYPCGEDAGGRNDFTELLVHDNYIFWGATLFRRAYLTEYGLFDQSLRINNENPFFRATDYDFVLRLAQAGFPFIFVDKAIAAFRSHSGQASGDQNYVQEGIQLLEHLVLLEKYIVPANYAKIQGYEQGIIDLLHQKIDALARYPENAGKLMPRIEKRIEKICLKIMSVSDGERKNRFNTPKVSVIVPTYNRPRMLEKALQSLKEQTFQDFEVVIVNDAGDIVEEIIRECAGEINVTYIRHARNKGLAAARNTGIHIAKGKYIAYLDDDDIYYPDHLQTLADFLESSGGKVAYSDAYRAHYEKKGEDYVLREKDLPYSLDFDGELILIQNFIPVNCIMHEKACLEQSGMFDESLSSHEDWDLWIRMSQKYNFQHIKKVTAEFSWRVDGSTMTSSGENDYARTREIINRRYKEITVQNIKKIFEDRPVYIWGGGSRGRWIYTVLREAGIDVNGFLDKNESLWGHQLDNLQVYSPEILVKQKDTKPFVVIGSMYVNEIKSQLKKWGYLEGKDF